MEGDRSHSRLLPEARSFQSTPSAWRETLENMVRNEYPKHFNPLPPHGGRQQSLIGDVFRNHISIHSLRMEGDAFRPESFPGDQHFNPLPPHGGRPAGQWRFAGLRKFQSTPSAWRETHICGLNVCNLPISIHSLRMEGDPEIRSASNRCLSFQSTPSAWRETSIHDPVETPEPFQSTPSAWRETSVAVSCRSGQRLFQSTPSAWRETEMCSINKWRF